MLNKKTKRSVATSKSSTLVLFFSLRRSYFKILNFKKIEINFSLNKETALSSLKHSFKQRNYFVKQNIVLNKETTLSSQNIVLNKETTLSSLKHSFRQRNYFVKFFSTE